LAGLSQTYSCTTAVFVDELDAGAFQGAPDYVQRCSSRFMRSRLELTHCYNANGGLVGQVLLAPVKKGPRGSTLFPDNHALNTHKRRIPSILLGKD
jgi:hypothetical protein